ncbi:MAG: FAD-dependent oxidoreductase [Patescibacteria group bacterium]|nr:FAD-dependent oxidoreductase [Patescibacteria group bacterium]
MKVAVIGGGLTGLVASYFLADHFEVAVFEKGTSFGGLAGGFRTKDWAWSLEYAYHHLFASDWEIIQFAKEIGFDRIIFATPRTGYLLENGSAWGIFPFDSALDLLLFPKLSLLEKIRVGLVFLFFKLSPFFSFYEKKTAKELLISYLGDRSYFILFDQLFRKKFGNFAENILATFIWARIKKRTKKLGYFWGGFQEFIDFLTEKLKKKGVRLFVNKQVDSIEKEKEDFLIDGEKFDVVIGTLCSPLIARVARKIFPAYFTQNLRKINYLAGLTLIIESKKPLLKDIYWLNISVTEIPIMVIVQHTNFIEKKYYNNHHLIYLGWYLDPKDYKLTLTMETLFKFVSPYLKKINPEFPSSVVNLYQFKNLYTQPIFDREFLIRKPEILTPVKNLYLANLEMTYPFDRGTNYAVKLGRQVAKKILSENQR